MIKEFQEEKTIKVTTKRTVCDLCGECIPGNVFITVNINVQGDINFASYPGSNRCTPTSIDVCCTQCLADNIGAIRLRFDTNEMSKAQELAEKIKDQMPKSVGDYMGLGATSSYITTTTAATSSLPTTGYYEVKI